MEPRLAAVTGGTGFLGCHIVRALVADGWRVRVLVRRDPVGPLWRGLRPEVVPGDLDDRASLERLCRGAQAVVHAAGLVKARSEAALRDVNVAGAARVAAVAQAQEPEARFVLVSSLAAREPHLSAYARSKCDGEDAVQQALGGGAQVVRPCAVYGPGDRETLALFRAAAASPVLPVLDETARVCLVHAADAAGAVAALAAGPAGPPLALSDLRADGYGWREIMTVAAEAVGRRPRLTRLPPLTLRALGASVDAARRLGATPMLESGKVRELLHRGLERGERGAMGARPRAAIRLARRFSTDCRLVQGGWIGWPRDRLFHDGIMARAAAVLVCTRSERLGSGGGDSDDR